LRYNKNQLTKIFDQRVRLRHTNNISNHSLCSNNTTTESVGIFFTELLEQNQAQLAEKLIFAALLDHDSQPGREIRGLLPDIRTLVVEPPENSRMVEMI